ncbi:hypothetical protein SASPL_113732 [Salvia splendens]|uniref:Uncharacterized protein n=1 Tax=Salvia splendens TaxID=180675 RepID=A0A8X8Y028_SALSN|nr:hypothetical protein SASPL_113732 [Salvia splendens]
MTMEAKTESVLDAPVVAPPGTVRDMSEAESLNLGVEELFVKVDQLLKVKERDGMQFVSGHREIRKISPYRHVCGSAEQH